ncbi:MAG: SCP-2 sterol transfer family protein [Cyanobacteria bacterium SID2]|nr:SCP-2 sterol transfer family protein [Cyanobacteria bacterium SID2]MBP0004656.1 SCP-2 sterol transfer family protein [Cyanobacteria bacterium SBC]
MADLFSTEWMAVYQDQWNGEPELSDALAKIDFTANIAYGFKDENAPRGVLVVENGKAVAATAFEGQTLNWDLRADRSDWEKWFQKGLNMMGLGMAYTTGKLKFLVGDYGAMVKDPRMVGPFIKSFSVMGKV